MKNLQDAINNHVMNSRNHKRYLAALIAMSMLVSFMVPFLLIEPAVSLTNDSEISPQAAGTAGNTVYSLKNDNPTTDVNLLAGSNPEGSIYAETVEGVIRNADAKYALGIASQFCVFLSGDFTEWQADAEGRVAVGGDIYFKDQYGSYAIGKGDFNNHVNLQRLLHNEGFASLILGGTVKAGQMDDTYFGDNGNKDNADQYNDDSGKTGDSGKKVDINQESFSGDSGFPESSAASWKKVDQSQVYAAKLFDFEQEFAKIKKNSKTLSNKAKGSAGIDITSDDINGDTVTFNANMLDETANVVYFNVSAEVWNQIKSCSRYKFEGIPNLSEPRTVVKSADASDVTWNYADIVINIEPNITDKFILDKDGPEEPGMVLANGDVKTSINGTSVAKGLDDKANNDIGVTSLLWNIYSDNEFNLKLGKNFQGTILAPNARVTDGGVGITGDNTDTAGHLSGALIAKSFNGGTEFGYRPYVGSVSLLGSSSGYIIPVDKFNIGVDPAERLAGASFVMKDKSGKEVNSWISKNSTEFAKLPSLIDLTGETDYSLPESILTVTEEYTITESSPPKGYIKTDKNYTVIVTETVNKDYLLPFGESTIPQVVDVVINISSNHEEANFPKEIRFQYRDSYEDTEEATNGMAQTQRKILVYDGENVSKVFTLNINTVGGSQTVTQLGTIDNWTDNYDVEEIASPQVTEAVSEETTEAVETTTQAIASESEISEEQNNDIPIESAPEIEPVNENANAADEVSGKQSADNAVTQYKKIKPIESTEITPPDGKDLKSSWEFTVDENNRYYYDNNSMMVIPLPDSNLKFENKPGLLFTKVDKTTGEILEGAEISITPEYTGFDASSGSFLFDIESLTENQVYTLTEGNPPPNYEKKDEPIYLQKRDGKLYYGETNPPETEIVKNDNGYYSFSMEDIKISGAKIKLGKWKSDYSTRLKGAKFQLQASSDKTVVYPLPATVKDTDNNDVPNTFTIPADKDFDLYTTLKNADPSTYDTNYIQNGYLKPGRYYLKEITPPAGYDAQEKFGFRVKDDYSIEAIASGTPAYISTELEKLNNDGGDKQVMVYPKNSNGDKISVSNVTKIEVELNKPSSGTLIVYDSNSFDNTTANIADSIATFELNNISFEKFKLQNNTYANGLDIKEIRIYGEEGAGSGSSTPTPYNIKSIMFNANGSLPNIEQITFYYSNKDPQSISNVSINDNSEWDHYFNLSNLDKQNVIGIKIKTGNTGDDWKKIIIRDSTDTLILGTTWDDNSAIKLSKNEERLFGFDKMPETTDSPNTPTTPENELLDLTIGNDGEIKIPNQKAGANMKVTVEKVWAGDEGFESLRPESISVTLKRKLPNGTVDNSFNDAKTLTSPDWKAEWSVPRLVDENGADAESNQYKYYVEENVTSNSYYDVSYSDNNEPGLSTAGTITITNTLQKDEISITKKWVVPEGVTSPVKPNHLNVTLKFTVNGTQQTKTVTLTPKDGSEDYTGSYEIPKGATDVSVEENSVPTGWKKQSVNSDKKTGFIITNVPDTTQLTVKKEWVNDTQSSRPQQIHFKLYRKVQSGGSSGDNADAPNFDPNDTDNLYPKNQTPEQVQEDYARLLQYSLYFYDANMCGSEVSEKSAFSKTNANGWRDDCHTDSGYVDGGYHDAGDHVMFGLPQGFTASTLGWSYYEFKDSYDTLGLTEHYKTIMKYFCDFFEKSIRTRNNTVEILVQKGDSSTDHNYWGAPETQSNYGSEIWVSDKGGNIAAQYAAALAQYSLNFPDDANSTSYLSKAIEFYNFATSHTTDYDVSNYDSKESADDIAWAAGWLYLATGKNNNDYLDKLNSCPNIDWLYNWNNVAMGAACLKAEINGDWSTVNSAIDSNFKNCNAKVGNYICLNDWGSARYSTLMQFVALVSDKNNNTETYKELCQGQMAYLLGDNSIESNGNTSTCFVTGFAPNSAKYPHHRAASGTSEAKTDQTKYQHQLVGALVGGPNTSGNYIDITDNGSELCYQVNEVALDYNAGLVGAAAGLYDAYGTGKTYSNVPPAQKLRTKVGPMKLNFNVNVNVLDAAEGNPVASYTGPYDGDNNKTLTIDPTISNVTKIEFQFDKVESWGGFSGVNLNEENANWHQASDFTVNGDIYTLTLDKFELSKIIFNMYGSQAKNIKIYTSGSGSDTTPTTPTEPPETTTTTTTLADTPTGTEVDCGNGIKAYINGDTVTYIFNNGYNDGTTFKVVKSGKIVAVERSNNIDNSGNGYWYHFNYNDTNQNNIIANNLHENQKKENLSFEVQENQNFLLQNLKYNQKFTLTLTYESTSFKITSSKDIIIPVDDDRTITANSKIASWSPTDNSNITITQKSDTELNVHANSYTDQQPITITLTGEDRNTDIVDVRIQGSDFEVSDAKIRIGGTPLTVDGTLTITEGSEFISIKGNTITAVSEGTAKVNVTKDGVTKPMTIEVFGVFSADTMTINKGKTKDPKINNLIGELELTILESTPEVEGTTVLEITEDGKIKTLNNGTVRIKVEDSFDNSEAEFTVTVKLTSELPELPADLNRTDDFVCEITLTKDDDWQQVLNLEKDDGNGHVYEYYVVEVNEKGDISDTNLIYGNNSVKYYPFDYDNNGATLNNGDQTITVKNEASEKPDNPDYTLPNTGGIGTGGFTTAGGAIIIGSTALYILSKRRRKKNVVR